MATVVEIAEIIDYVFDNVLPKTREVSRDEFTDVLIDELIDAEIIEIEDEEGEEEDEEVTDAD